MPQTSAVLVVFILSLLKQRYDPWLSILYFDSILLPTCGTNGFRICHFSGRANRAHSIGDPPQGCHLDIHSLSILLELRKLDAAGE